MAVALDAAVYVWNAVTGDIKRLVQLDGFDAHVCSLKWCGSGNGSDQVLAVGDSNGKIGLWCAIRRKRLRSISGHVDRVGSLSWNKHVLSSGCKSGMLHHCDVRIASHVAKAVRAHRQEICGLTWSHEGDLLATGSNDNLLKIWPCEDNRPGITADAPLHIFSNHVAAVKAIAWCPWQRGVLASGGGSADKHIRIWNCNTGASMNAVDTGSQVTSLVWSDGQHYKELVSAHGYKDNQVTVWKFPSMTKAAELSGHTDRVLHLCLSPDGTMIVSAGADETLRLWKPFAPDPTRRIENRKSKRGGTCNLLNRGAIR